MTLEPDTYAAWLVDGRLLRSQLSERGFAPAHDDVVLHHVTFQFPAVVPPPSADAAAIVGYVAGDGVDCLVVTVGGSSRRPDGGTLHITYSVATGHAAVESNDAIPPAP